jgi:predicted RNA binding protein YcfA (HicA-like mRNA interferase family)
MSVYEVCILEVKGRAAMNSRDVIRRLKDAGWFEVAQAGSHKQFKHPVKPGRVTVPFPKPDIPIGALKSIEKQSGIKFS